MPLGIKRPAKPDPDAQYVPIMAFSGPHGSFSTATRLSGSHPAVRGAFDRWMDASLADDEKGRLRAEAMFGNQPTPAHATHEAPPIAERPSGRFRCLVSRTLSDPDLASRARLSPGDVVTADDPVYVRFPHLFTPLEEDR